MVGLGSQLALQGGSVFFAFSGALLLLSGLQLFRRRDSAIHLAGLNFVATWIWAVAEVGFDGWAILPRVNFITVLLPLYALPLIRDRLRTDGGNRGLRLPIAAYPTGVAAVVAGFAALIVAQGAIRSKEASGPSIAARSAQSYGGEGWTSIGQDPGAAKFSSLAEINRDNVRNLKRVWTFQEPDTVSSNAAPRFRDEAVPIEVDGKLFVCLANNTIVALDAEDGHLLWRHDPRVDLTGVPTGICRGVAYYATAAASGAKTQDPCARRILFATLDARLMAIDAETGQACEDFGQRGEVSLKVGLGPVPQGQYYQTSPPIVVDGLAVIGGLVQDNLATGEPSGVIRAYDARNGKLAWAWDLGRPSESGEPVSPATYTRGTPNSWTLLSADPALGLVYIPTGNSTPDFVASYRQPAWEKYSSSIVALEVRTGKVRWSYQFVHHDLWDYDTSAQPVLFDMPTDHGPVPALLQATKSGQLFVLDRRTGAPLTAVVEKPVPQTDVAGERTSPTQPFSLGMPDVGGPPLTEAAMWGISPFDQLLCRRKFHRLRYDGIYTPPSLQGSIIYPSQLGGVDWGGLSIDNGRNLLIVPSLRLATVIQLAPRDAPQRGKPFDYPQAGTPYGAYGGPFMTALGVPCQQPPYTMLTAIDLRSRKVVWERPLGTAEGVGPFGIASHLPFVIGAPPVVGGPITTATDLTFIGAVGDRRLRAIDSLTGHELWSDKLPAGNQTTPITYRAPRSGRQMIVMVSGREADMTGKRSVATHVVAYALR